MSATMNNNTPSSEEEEEEDCNNKRALKAPQPRWRYSEESNKLKSRINRTLNSPVTHSNERKTEFPIQQQHQQQQYVGANYKRQRGMDWTTPQAPIPEQGQQQQRGTDAPIYPTLPRLPSRGYRGVPTSFVIQHHAMDSISLLTCDEEVGIEMQNDDTSNSRKHVLPNNDDGNGDDDDDDDDDDGLVQVFPGMVNPRVAVDRQENDGTSQPEAPIRHDIAPIKQESDTASSCHVHDDTESDNDDGKAVQADHEISNPLDQPKYSSTSQVEAPPIGRHDIPTKQQAQDTTKPPMETGISRGKRRILIAMTLLVLVAIAATVGGIYGSRAASLSSSSSSVIDTLPPTMAPTTTILPEMTAGSSCQNATALATLPFTQTGNASTLHRVSVDVDAVSCPTIVTPRWVAWYAVNGTDSCLFASTERSTFVMALSVYRGTCGSVTCLREDNGIGTSAANYVEWFGHQGETYYILLSSETRSDSHGNFNLSISEFDCVRNEACVDATPILDTPFSDSGSTIAGAEVQRRSQALACSVVSRGTLGVWYVVQASAVDNTCITVSTARSDFNTILAVYNGTCNNLTCVTENDDSSSLVRTSQVSFTAERGVLYYVFVGGADDDDAGDFIFSLLELQQGFC